LTSAPIASANDDGAGAAVAHFTASIVPFIVVGWIVHS
jgi:hypothetical protein